MLPELLECWVRFPLKRRLRSRRSEELASSPRPTVRLPEPERDSRLQLWDAGRFVRLSESTLRTGSAEPVPAPPGVQTLFLAIAP